MGVKMMCIRVPKDVYTCIKRACLRVLNVRVYGYQNGVYTGIKRTCYLYKKDMYMGIKSACVQVTKIRV